MPSSTPWMSSASSSGQLHSGWWPQLIQVTGQPPRLAVSMFAYTIQPGLNVPTEKATGGIAAKSPVSNAYYQLRRHVITPTKESQMQTHLPCEFSADVQQLTTMLEAGHFGVELDPQSWETLYTWIDLNAPYFGNWGEMLKSDNPKLVDSQWKRREELRDLYAPSALPLDDDPNASTVGKPLDDSSLRVRFSTARNADLDFSVAAPDADAEPIRETVELGDGETLELVSIPGTNLSVGTTEITNALPTRRKARSAAPESGADGVPPSPTMQKRL